MGLGQIAVKLNTPTQRALIGVGVTQATVSRNYVMVGPELRYLIKESFHRRLYQELGSGTLASASQTEVA